MSAARWLTVTPEVANACLSLTSQPDDLRLTLNGTQASGLFRAGILGSQTAHLAPDDGLVHGRNVLRVVAVRDGVTYHRRSVTLLCPAMADPRVGRPGWAIPCPRARIPGTNCAAEIAGCPPNEVPGQVQVYPYQSGYPVQLLILAREDLSKLWSSSYVGNGGDAFNVVTAIQNISNARTKAGFSKPIVILSALDGPREISTDFQTLSLPTILSKTNWQQDTSTWFDMVTNNPG